MLHAEVTAGTFLSAIGNMRNAAMAAG